MNEDYEVIKQIGRGSFSNVYLCKQEIPLFISESDHHDELFIIKEININKLVKSYILKNGGSNVKRVSRKVGSVKENNDNIGVNITPYETDDVLDNAEQNYYYKRLQELIESEIEILSNLDHQNVIKFYGYTHQHGIYYLRMEYCNGGDVYEFLKETSTVSKFNLLIDRNSSGGFTNTFLYEFCCQIVNGLDYIHNKNIIHRDIKLHNILIKNVNNKLEFKISDFGFACYDLSDLSDLADQEKPISESMCKKYYKLCGTPYYMAPEIILNINNMENITSYKNGRPNIVSDLKKTFIYNKGIDIWSLGVCIYELMFNILPFSNIKNINDLERFYSLETIQEIMDKKINRRSCLKPDFKNMLLSILKIDKTQRCSVSDIDFFLKKCNGISGLINDKNQEQINIQDIVNCRENMFVKNEDMKQHIIKNPVIKESKINNELNLSWEKINKSSSLIMKMSVQGGFLKWLFNKK